MMTTQEILTIVMEVVLIPVLTALTGIVVKWLNSKANEIKAKTDNIYLQRCVDMLNDTIATAVVSVNQTYVDALKESGDFSEEAQKEAFNKVYNAVMTSLTESAKTHLNEVIGDLEAYVSDKIEEAVVINKTV